MYRGATRGKQKGGRANQHNNSTITTKVFKVVIAKYVQASTKEMAIRLYLNTVGNIGGMPRTVITEEFYNNGEVLRVYRAWVTVNVRDLSENRAFMQVRQRFPDPSVMVYTSDRN